MLRKLTIGTSRFIQTKPINPEPSGVYRLYAIMTTFLKYHHNLIQTMLSVNCRDVGVNCDFKGSGETEEELMNNLVEHAIKDHGYTREDVMKPEMQEKIKAHIQKS